jgi:hypothetical protein
MALADHVPASNVLSAPPAPVGKPRGARAAARLWAPLLSLLSVLIGACGGDSEGGNKDEGDLVTEWKSGGGTLAKALHDEELFEDLADALNSGLKLPRDLPIVHKLCGEENAFYDPNSGELQLCYELLDSIYAVSKELAADDEEAVERAVGTWLFVTFHELGHGLIDLYGLPITGKEEDAVDDFSTLLMIQADMAEYAAYAADYWNAIGTDVSSETSFADEHSLNAQRFFNILCLIYGSDPNKYDVIVSGGFLPQARAVRCPGEYAQKDKAWGTLLEPWAKD